jgi:hypothetical protein
MPVIPTRVRFRETLKHPSFQRFRALRRAPAALIRLNQVIRQAPSHHPFMENESGAPRLIEKLSRPQAIEKMRQKLRKLTDQDHCVCAVVGELGIFCKGFKGLPEKELRQRYHWISRRRPNAPRELIEELANLYQLGRQEVTGAAISCDVETREHAGCDGWNTFNNQQLEEFYLALTGEQAEIG